MHLVVLLGQSEVGAERGNRVGLLGGAIRRDERGDLGTEGDCQSAEDEGADGAAGSAPEPTYCGRVPARERASLVGPSAACQDLNQAAYSEQAMGASSM